MGAAVWHSGYKVVAVNLEIEYRKPLPLGAELYIWGEIVERTGRAIRARGEIVLPGERIAVVGRGIYVEAPHLFVQLGEQSQSPSWYEPVSPDDSGK
jgi:acyl-CoA thioesterase FadM